MKRVENKRKLRNNLLGILTIVLFLFAYLYSGIQYDSSPPSVFEDEEFDIYNLSTFSYALLGAITLVLIIFIALIFYYHYILRK